MKHTPVDMARSFFGELFRQIGEDKDRQGLYETPERFLKAFQEMTDGYNSDPSEMLKLFETDRWNNEIILVKDVDFVSMCEHHLMPFVGVVHLGYIPASSQVVGLSKLPRVIDAFARRLQVQERMTTQIAEAVQKHVPTIGVACVVEASHGCLSCRGARKPNARMVTSAMLGAFREDAKTRSEFFQLIHLDRR